MSVRKKEARAFFSVQLALQDNLFCFPRPSPCLQKAEDYVRMGPHPPTAVGENPGHLLQQELAKGEALHCSLNMESITTHSSGVCASKGPQVIFNCCEFFHLFKRFAKFILNIRPQDSQSFTAPWNVKELNDVCFSMTPKVHKQCD